LLHQSAVERMTIFRELEALDFGSVLAIVTKDFEALIAYKHGGYRQCLQLSTQNAHALWNTKPAHVHIVRTLPVFVQLLDDGIVSVIALTLIVNPECRCYTAAVLASLS